jgi:hypothetical protein
VAGGQAHGQPGDHQGHAAEVGGRRGAEAEHHRGHDRAHRHHAGEQPRTVGSEPGERVVPEEEGTCADDGAQVDQRGRLCRGRQAQHAVPARERPGDQQERDRHRDRVGGQANRPQLGQQRDREQGEARLARQGAEGVQQPGRAAAAKPAGDRGADDHDERGNEDASGWTGPRQQRPHHPKHHRHRPDDRADQGGAGVPGGLDDAHVEQRQPGGRQRQQQQRLTRREPDKAKSLRAGDRGEDHGGHGVAHGLPPVEGVAVDHRGAGRKRADQEHRGGGAGRPAEQVVHGSTLEVDWSS